MFLKIIGIIFENLIIQKNTYLILQKNIKDCKTTVF